jgi:hypothetical protein
MLSIYRMSSFSFLRADRRLFRGLQLNCSSDEFLDHKKLGVVQT